MTGLSITAQKMQKISSRIYHLCQGQAYGRTNSVIDHQPTNAKQPLPQKSWLYIFLERISMFPSLREEARRQVPAISASSRCGINVLKMPTKACEF